jgi:hypothetical protein
MRLMLGTPGKPSLLVDVDPNFNRNYFDFWVVNGAWDGTFKDGYIYVRKDTEHTGSKVEILTDNQDRLRCGQNGSDNDYNAVFDNFDNPNYVAPLYKYNKEDFEDDDIPF